MIKGIAALLLGLLLANAAHAENPQPCPEKMAGETSCIEGGLMQCAREFDPALKKFRYVWHGVNNSGQPFDVSTPLYKKVPGMTPAACNATEPGTARPLPQRGRAPQLAQPG